MCIVLYTLQEIVILSQSKIQTQVAVNVYLNQPFVHRDCTYNVF